jgi:transposase
MKAEVLAGPERRRRWGSEEKAGIVAETMAPGVRVSEIARRHGISRGLLYTWRREAGQHEVGSALPDLVPVVMASAAEPVAPPVASPERQGAAGKPNGTIEIAMPSGVRVMIRGRVEERSLRAILGALRSA